jgi:hypothetical protein
MSSSDSSDCCPKFDPAPWDEKELSWENRCFLKDRVRCFLHIPLNFGAVMRRNVPRIEAANAKSASMLVLLDENSLWGSDVYIEVTGEVPDAQITSISGTFLSKVFEEPYGNMRKWIGEMRAFVGSRGKSFGTLYFYYTTCPKCAKKYGKNYVVILAQL